MVGTPCPVSNFEIFRGTGLLRNLTVSQFSEWCGPRATKLERCLGGDFARFIVVEQDLQHRVRRSKLDRSLAIKRNLIDHWRSRDDAGCLGANHKFKGNITSKKKKGMAPQNRSASRYPTRAPHQIRADQHSRTFSQIDTSLARERQDAALQEREPAVDRVRAEERVPLRLQLLQEITRQLLDLQRRAMSCDGTPKQSHIIHNFCALHRHASRHLL